MTTIKINEQITFYRKRTGLTQEELARALGVTNQAVSKWESAQCCPDIQLLPDIARLFGVSVDELLGHTPASPAEDALLPLRRHMNALSKAEAFSFARQISAALHVMVLSKAMTTTSMKPDWDADGALAPAMKGEWGYSAFSVPEITTAMRQSAVFFAGNQDEPLSNADLLRIADLLEPLSDAQNLKITAALYALTRHSEAAYAAAGQIADHAGMSAGQVLDRLGSALAPLVAERSAGTREFRLNGPYLSLLPILSLLAF